jgi:hypothetical protein
VLAPFLPDPAAEQPADLGDLPADVLVLPLIEQRPWLGFVVFPTHHRLKSCKVVQATRRLGERYREWQDGLISFGEFDASVQGWINHVLFADSWRLREHVLRTLHAPTFSTAATRRSAAKSGQAMGADDTNRNPLK